MNEAFEKWKADLVHLMECEPEIFDCRIDVIKLGLKELTNNKG